MKEGSKKDIREDRRFAKRAKMSLKDWEASPADERHDAGKKVFAKGGKVRGAGAAVRGFGCSK